MFGYDPHDIYYVMMLVSSAIIVILSVLLMGIHIPKSEPWTKLRSAQKYLSLSYFLLGACGFSEILFGMAVDPVILILSTSFVSALQALLFTATFLVILQPQVVKVKRIAIHLVIIFSIGIILSLLYWQFGKAIGLFISISSIVIYLIQQCYYVSRFRKHYKRCVAELEEYYDEDQDARLRWIKFSLYSGLFIGMFAIIASLSSLWVYYIFILIYTCYYAYMTIRFNNYRLWANALVPEVSAMKVEDEPVFTEGEILTDENVDLDQKDRDHLFGERLQTWVEEKGYLDKDISVDEITRILGTDRNYLRYYFRTYIHNDFRTWRVELRIEEAKRIMREHPEYSLTQVGEMVGFNHRSNFFNQFQKMTGCSLSDYREVLQKQK